MHLSQLHIHNFRNIHDLKLELSPCCNLFFGKNGSGKTSILEAIYYLSTARSFRSHLFSRIIRQGSDKFTLYAMTEDAQRQISVGIERAVETTVKMHIQGENVASIAELAKFLPIQFLHQDSFELLTFGPKYKRKFIDWGLFHVEHGFLAAWKNYKMALDQKNAALKISSNNAAGAWDQELAKWGIILHNYRYSYVTQLTAVINELLPQLLGNFLFTINYYAGWNIEEDLYTLLQKNNSRDLTLGFTHVGPHRADLRLLINKTPVQEFLSRGQQKTFLFILYLAQGLLLQKISNKTCIYLIDDLAAELDQEKQEIIAKMLSSLQAQIFVTALEEKNLQNLRSYMSNIAFQVVDGAIVNC